MGVAMALGGHRFLIQHHNQPDSWWNGRGDARVEARGRGERVGGRRPIVWTIKLIDNKIPKKMHVGLRWLPFQNFTHNNHQKHAEMA
jgi:hypothetical protein